MLDSKNYRYLLEALNKGERINGTENLASQLKWKADRGVSLEGLFIDLWPKREGANGKEVNANIRVRAECYFGGRKIHTLLLLEDYATNKGVCERFNYILNKFDNGEYLLYLSSLRPRCSLKLIDKVKNKNSS